jgi:hypothetical protein
MAFNLEAAKKASADEKLNLLLNAVSQLLQGQEKIEKLAANVCALETKVASHETTIKTLELEVKKLKEFSNDREQELRENVIRLFNFPMSPDDSAADHGKALANRVYEKILKPIIVAAKAKDDLGSVHQLNSVIDDCFRIGKPSLKDGILRPSPVIIKLRSKQLKQAIMKNKRNSIPTPSEREKSAGIKRFLLVEDLTPPTFKKLSEILADERVEKAWSIEGQIRFVLVGNDKTVKKVKSVFDPTSKIIESAMS